MSRFDSVELLGEGGMGTVYRGHDARFDRMVALKVLRDDDSEFARRLLVEARAQARIEHPHVCRIYEVGEADGEPFICMQYIRGEPIDRVAADLTRSALLELIRKVALALHEAHGLGIIHRDLKPANILVERGLDGAHVPYLVDFGLARELLTARGHTATGEVLGTPAYMSPEQALGQWRSVDQRCDIWGLGATLYDLLAGHPPFVAEHPWRVLMMVANEEPPSLRVARPDLPAALVTIVMKCLERDSARRYPSAQALAEDLGRFLASKPIVARPPSLAYRLWKRARQHRLPLALLFGMLLLAVLGLVAWADALRDAEDRARLSAEFGREVASIEQFMRSARQMPLHDIEQERAVVRQKVLQLEARVADADAIAEGPGHTALGVAYLELGNLEAARRHLERAAAAGESSPQLHYALGLTLARLYDSASRDMRFRFAESTAWRAYKARLDEEHHARSLVHLRIAAMSGFHVQPYAEGLLASYEDRHLDALERARAAFSEAPWLYEAKLLEGRTLHALAAEAGASSQPGWEERMETHMRGAIEALDIAAQMGRSDVDVYRTACGVWTRAMITAYSQDRSTRSLFDRGELACARAELADGADPGPAVERALLHALFVYATTRNPRGSLPTPADLDRATALAEAAIARTPEGPHGREALAIVLRTRIIYTQRMGRAADVELLERARSVLEGLLDTHPGFGSAHDQLLQLEELSAQQEMWHGIDVGPRVERAVAELAALEAREHANSSMYTRLARLHVIHAAQRLERGQSPAPVRERVTSLLDRGGTYLGDIDAIPYAVANVDLLVGAHAVQIGADPAPSIAAVQRTIDRAGADTHAWVTRLDAHLRLLEAQRDARNGDDPGRSLARARTSLRRLFGSDPMNLSDRVLHARVELLAARWAASHGEPATRHFDLALVLLRPLTSDPIENPAHARLLAQVHQARQALRPGRSVDLPEEPSVQGVPTR